MFQSMMRRRGRDGLGGRQIMAGGDGSLSPMACGWQSWISPACSAGRLLPGFFVILPVDRAPQEVPLGCRISLTRLLAAGQGVGQ